MKVKQDTPDRCGRYPIIFSGYKNIEEVHEWLWQHFQGYHFTIMMDCTKDEYEPVGKDLYVYFSDEALDEICAYTGYKAVKVQ